MELLLKVTNPESLSKIPPEFWENQEISREPREPKNPLQKEVDFFNCINFPIKNY